MKLEIKRTVSEFTVGLSYDWLHNERAIVVFLGLFYVAVEL
jgi:hypothetical protein